MPTPSEQPDPRTRLALEALRAPRERFDSAVADAAERLRALVVERQAPAHGRASRMGRELGAFASDRLDFDRFASAFAEGESLPPAALARIQAAHDVLAGLIREGIAPHVVRMRPGEDPRLETGYMLAHAGRAFGAARAATRARNGTGGLADEAMMAGFPFRNWNRAERAIAPPLVLELEGEDLHASGLGEFLDGALKLVLVARGAGPAAALAEVITPGVFVAQAGGEDAERVLQRLAAFDGPGVVALLEGDFAHFVHDPSRPHAERLAVAEVPEPTGAATGRMSGFRNDEAVHLLRLLARGYAAAGAARSDATGGNGIAPEGAADGDAILPADRLAAWLIRQADLPEPGR